MTTDPRRAEAERIAAEVVRGWAGDVNGTLGAYISKSDEAILAEGFADALLAAEERGARGQWQQIDTAPKDGSWFVICRADEGEDSYEVGQYAPHLHPRYSHVEGDMYRKTLEPVYDWRGFNNFHRASHWMPLPPLPSPQEGE